MTAGTARQFIELLERDSSLQTQFMVASPTSVDGILDFASGKGYIFTKEDLMNAIKAYPESRIAQELRQRVH
jgi:predicted ribosomally synthesized peptide with nif11-like leader